MPFKVSNKFKQAMKAPIKQVQAKIVDGETAYSSSDVLSSFSIEQNGYFFGAAVKVVEFKLLGTDYDLLDHTIRVSFDTQTDAANDVWETLNYGAFKVKEQTADLEKSVTTFKAYDLIGLAAYQEYSGTDIEFPCTLKSMIEQTAIKLSSSISTDLTTLPNYDYEIKENLYEKITGTTYRNILAEIAGATATMCMMDDDGKLSFIAPPQTTEEEITYADMIKIKLEPEYGPVNTVTLSRQPQEDNIVVQNRPYGTASGKEIEITDPGDSLKSLSLMGDTEQQTYSGKNLYNYEDSTNIGSGITVEADGWITVSYDNTNGASTHYENYFTGIISQLSTSTSYAVVAEIKDVSTSGEVLLYPISGSNQAQFGNTTTVRPSNYPNGGVEIELNTTLTSFASSTSSLRSSVAFRAGAKGTFSFRLSLLADTSVTPETFSYEPYVGGTASPNPDYPQEVQTVTGRQVVEVYGKNLWNKERISWYRNNSGLFTNTDDTSTTRIRTNSFAVSGGKTYTISGIPDGITLISVRAFAREDASQTTNPVLKGNTFTTSDDTRYIHLLFGGTNFSSATNTLMANADIQLELGSTATPYQAHQSYEVNLGKNLMILPSIIEGTATLSKIRLTDNSFSTIWDNTAGADQTAMAIVSVNGLAANTTYTLSYNTDITGSTLTRSGIARLRLEGVWTSIYSTGGKLTFTTGATGATAFGFYNAQNDAQSGSNTISYNNIQLELGSTATTYAPYFEPIELRKIGIYRDGFWKNDPTKDWYNPDLVDNAWYLHKAIQKTILGQDELDSNWYTVGSTKKVFAKRTRFGAYSTSVQYIISDSFMGAARDNIGSNTICLTDVGDIRFDTLNIYTKDEFLALIASRNVAAYYVLPTPTDTQITNPELTKQLEATNVAELYPDYAKIKTESEDVPATLDLEYYKPFTPYEVKLANNEILDDDRELLAQPILDAVNGFSFYPFEARTTGHGWHKPGDRIRATDGTNTWDLIVTYVKTELSASGFKETIKGVAPTETQTNYALAGGITKTVYNTEIKVDKQNQQIESIVSEVEELNGRSTENYTQIIQNITNINNTIQTSGGNNLLYNSVGYATDTSQVPTVWDVTGTVTAYTSPESLTFGAKSGNQINLAAGASISQTIITATNEPISLSARVKKGKVGAVTIKIAAENGNSETITIEDQKEYVWQEVSISAFEPTSNTVTVTITASSTVTSFAITDLMLVSGDHTTVWQQASGEILNTNVLIDKDGIVVKNNVYAGDYVQITPLEFAGYSAVSGYTQKVFSLNRDTTQVQKLAATGQISMPPIKIVPITSGSRAGWAFVTENK